MVVILAGGPIKDYQRIKKLIKEGCRIICADGGAVHAKAMGVKPDLIIGDMDSVSEEVLQHYRLNGVETCPFPREKDEVDTELAIEKAVKLGCREILLLGATGGRIDHTLGNIHLLVKAANLGVKATMVDERHRISLATAQQGVKICGPIGGLVSLLPLTTEVTGVTSTGLKWELNDGSFRIGKPFGISNELVDTAALVSVKEGILAVIEVLNEEK
ncbi:thiamine diphosphokinase [Desulfofalx alkaliphila]|uniref:thiamine diphosphokinase n=1 Tax=Desulfofalx alkaliphila TaxID=105483 RepID=UPI000689DCB3|nr:thiamine diphosphokinase [Desulfofalx alkaliphila]